MRVRRFFCACVCAAVAVFVLGGCSSSVRTPDIPPHLEESGESSPVRVVDGRDGVAMSEFTPSDGEGRYRERVDELYSVVVFDEKKPLFSDGDPLKAVYDNAVAVLDKYVRNSWHTDDDGEYNIVHTVHDWLVCNVDYDFRLFESYKNGNTDLQHDPSFDIDGVFLNGRAVCDGISRAFDFLCALDGISSFRVTGSYSSAPHAWNKVRINGKWYNVDVTADAAYYSIGNATERQLSHGFFLVSDGTISNFMPSAHVFTEPPFTADEDFDYYGTEQPTAEINGKTYSLVIKNKTELDALFSAISSARTAVGKIEFKLDFAGKSHVNDLDVYANELKSAYSLVSGSSYDFSSTLPYIRYPNGVYMCLIYR